MLTSGVIISFSGRRVYPEGELDIVRVIDALRALFYTAAIDCKGTFLPLGNGILNSLLRISLRACNISFTYHGVV